MFVFSRTDTVKSAWFMNSFEVLGMSQMKQNSMEGCSLRECNKCVILCVAVCGLAVAFLDTHRFDVVTKQDVSHVAGALVTLHVQLPLWTHRRVSCGSAGVGNSGE